jgi:uncharacterized protein
MQPFTLLIKPSGSDCNLDCKYCFYKDRPPISPATCGQGLPPAQVRGLNGRQRMSTEVLEKLVSDYMQLRLPVSVFIWQGGEPTLMGIDFFNKAIGLQKKYGAPGQEVGNCLQTNAILLDEKWCQFLHDNNFLVGISIDGPKQMHDYYRLDHANSSTFEKVIRAVEMCKQYKVEFNTLTLLNDKNIEHPDEIFDFFIKLGVEYLQFIPCVELDPATCGVSDFSIKPRQYGDFLCRLFDRWYEYGPWNLRIRQFDSILSYCLRHKHTICTFDKQCSQYVVVEHNGDVFCCDFFVEPDWWLGNILQTPLEELTMSTKKRNFARAKQNLSNKCLLCRHLAICRGGCLKDRAVFGRDKFNSESYFCQSYQQFFDYTMARFMQIAAEISVESVAKKHAVTPKKFAESSNNGV